MSTGTTAHVNFRGQAREALTSSAEVFGEKAMTPTYADIHHIDESAQSDSVA
ncbi:hypothetical protein [Frondihabitans sp. 762G35]|uniref:hypothetical protein n=1 Tax=Frondihabitans sp. 762G35 TaxID=1446794 RepID=UPI0013D95240|nr:hypothetical protein [Frondihabitans sp. 762G35]